MAPQLPGFYFDEEKKKYFKIQPNHIAPNVKYSRSNVKHEQHLAKKQKVKDDHKTALRTQTVVPARISKNTLLANGLYREYGFDSVVSSLQHREDAFLHSIRHNISRNMIFPTTVLDAHRIPRSIAVVASSSLTSYALPNSENQSKSAATHFTAPAGVSIVSSCVVTTSGTPCVLGHTTGSSQNAFLAPIDDSERTAHVWQVDDVITACAGNDLTGATIALAGNSRISIVEAGRHTAKTSIPLGERTQSSAIEWIGVHTVAYGACESQGKKQFSKHKIILWDVRSPTARAARFTRAKRITGLSRPDTSGNNLIVTSNYDISLYDLRQGKADRPLLSIPHMSAGPVTYHDTHNGSMLAAIDHRQEIQTYSWRTGKHVKTVASQQRYQSSSLMRNVRWYDGQDGPFLQACQEKTVLTYDM